MKPHGLFLVLLVVLNASLSESHADIVYGVDLDTDQLLTIDQTTGAATAIGAVGFDFVFDLTYVGSTNTLYGIDGATSQLITIDRSTGAGTAVGSHGVRSLLGLAHDTSTNTLYASSVSTDQLYTVDPTTGATTAVGALGFGDVLSLEYDSSTDTLFGQNWNSSEGLISINRDTGAGTFVGNWGAEFGVVSGLAINTTTDTTFAVDVFGSQLLTIDLESGAATAVGPTGVGQIRAIVFVPTSIPEPSSMAVVGFGILINFACLRRKRRVE